MTRTDDMLLLEDLFHVAVEAAKPERTLARHLPEKPKGRTIVVGAGKGAAQMAAALEAAWDGPIEGVVVTRYGYGAECKHIKILEAAHPVPDEAGLRGADAVKAAVANLTEDDLVIALVAGGGSALLPAPPEGFSLDDEIALNKALLASGAPIRAMNAVRKHFSTIKGGRLAALAHPARVVSLLVSDIPGDVASAIASGPTVPDEANRDDALAAIRTYGIDLPQAIIDHIGSEASSAPQPGDAVFARNTVQVIASARLSLLAAADKARALGLNVLVLSDAMEGEAREIGLAHAAIARHAAQFDQPVAKPALILSGGELTVTLDKAANGKGGPNTEFLLSFAKAISGEEGITALSADTDGIDGSEDNAGAFCDGETAAAMLRIGIDLADSLARHDAWSAFHSVGTVFSPGPTGTNVNDFRAILVR